MKRYIKIKAIAALLFTGVLLLSGCRYEYPLTQEHSIPVDSSLPGLWEHVPQAGNEEIPAQRLMILKFSDSEYLVHYPADKDGIYYRAYPIQVGNLACVQLEVIGTKDGPPGKDEKRLFQVVSYSLTESGLEVKTLNADLMGDEFESGEALAEAFLRNRDNKNLFVDPDRFRRIEE